MNTLPAEKTNTPRPRRRWFQFKLRTLLLAMLVFGCGFGWIAAERHKASQQKAAYDAINALGGQINGGWLFPTRSKWTQAILGDDSYGAISDVEFRSGEKVFNDASLAQLHEIGHLPRLKAIAIFGSEISDAGLNDLAKLHQIERLGLLATKITDEGLIHLQNLPRLIALNISNSNSPISDAGLAHIAKLKQLKLLVLRSAKISKAGLVQLQSLPKLRVLTLGCEHITDAHLVDLQKLTQLRYLNIHATQVTEAGAQQLQKALPQCEIVWTE